MALSPSVVAATAAVGPFVLHGRLQATDALTLTEGINLTDDISTQ